MNPHDHKHKVMLRYIRERIAGSNIPEDQKSIEDPAKQTKAVEELVRNTVMEKLPYYKDKVFSVGGFVRDDLLGKNPKDIDLVVDDPKTKMKAAEIFSKEMADILNIRTPNNPHPLNETYGIWGLVLFNPKSSTGTRDPFIYGGVDITGYVLELTPPRREGPYKPGKREPEYVEYTSREDDAKRRDLTINALYKNIVTGDIEDYVGGRKDLEGKILKPPPHPEGIESIYKEDPLRILRLIRFSGKLGGFKIDPGTESVLKNFIGSSKGKEIISSKVSAERIRDEFKQILTHPKGEEAVKGLELLHDFNLLDLISPDLDRLFDIYHDKIYHQGESVWDHTMDVLRKTPPTLKARLSALFHDIGKLTAMSTELDSEGRERVHFKEHEDEGVVLADKALRDLKFPNDIINSVKKIIQSHMGFKDYESLKRKTFSRRIRIFIEKLYEDLEDALAVLKADAMKDPVEEKKVLDLEIRIKDQLQKDMKAGLLKEKDKGVGYVDPLSGKEIMELYDTIKGKTLGVVKTKLKQMLMEGQFDNLDEKQRAEKAKELLKGIAQNEQVLNSLLNKLDKDKNKFYSVK